MFFERKRKPIIYTIEECQKCKGKVKRAFRQGDHVYKESGECQKCGVPMLITMIYAEIPGAR